MLTNLKKLVTFILIITILSIPTVSFANIGSEQMDLTGTIDSERNRENLLLNFIEDKSKQTWLYYPMSRHHEGSITLSGAHI